MNQYSYKELYAKATGRVATQKDIDALGEWFSQYGAQFWNGEYYDADRYRLFPVYQKDESGDDNFIIIGYERRP